MTDLVATDPVAPVTPVAPTAPVTVEATSPVTPVAPVVPVAPTIVNTPTQTVPADFPDNWRDKFASGDAKEVARLARFADPTAVYKAYRELENKLASGQVKTPLPKDASPEQVAAYRKENGVPETPGAYELELSPGVVIGESDEPIVGHMLQWAHSKNMSSPVVSEMVDQYFQARQAEQAVMVEKQKQIRFENEEALRAKWGGNFIPNVMAVKNLLAGAGELGEQLMVARMPDGSLLGNNASALEYLAALALDLNPAGTVVPGSSANQAQAISDELGDLEKLMKKDINAWRKNAPAKARHLELLDAQVKLKARGY